MNYFKDNNNKIYAFTDSQVKKGLANDFVKVSKIDADKIRIFNDDTLSDEEFNNKLNELNAKKAEQRLSKKRKGNAKLILNETNFIVANDVFSTLSEVEKDNIVALRQEAISCLGGDKDLDFNALSNAREVLSKFHIDLSGMIKN